MLVLHHLWSNKYCQWKTENIIFFFKLRVNKIVIKLALMAIHTGGKLSERMSVGFLFEHLIRRIFIMWNIYCVSETAATPRPINSKMNSLQRKKEKAGGGLLDVGCWAAAWPLIYSFDRKWNWGLLATGKQLESGFIHCTAVGILRPAMKNYLRNRDIWDQREVIWIFWGYSIHSSTVQV